MEQQTAKGVEEADGSADDRGSIRRQREQEGAEGAEGAADLSMMMMMAIKRSQRTEKRCELKRRPIRKSLVNADLYSTVSCKRRKARTRSSSLGR